MIARALIAPIAWVLLQQAPAPEDVVRDLVRQYYEAQTRKDADAAAAFWSTTVNPRMTRESYLAMFSAGDADYTPDVQTVTVTGDEARVRVTVAVARTVFRNDVPVVLRQSLLNALRWRREGLSWKLVREGPFTDEIADDLIAAPPASRPALYEEHRAVLTQIRLAISQRATMAITLGKDYVRGRELFALALEVSRVSGDRRGQTNSLHNIAQANYFLGNRPAAAEAYTQELAVARESDDQDAAGAALFGLATVAYSRAEYTPALGFYREALTVYEKRDDASAIGRTLVSIGNVQYVQAEYDPSAASYRRALAMLDTGLDPQGASLARGGLARVYAAQGDLVAALDMYGQVLADARARQKMDPRLKSEVAVTLESIGEVYFRIGNSEQARTNLEEARRLSDTDPAALGRLSSTLGLVELVAGRYDAALAAYTESRTRFDQAKLPEGVARAWTGTGFSQAAREKWVDAIAAYKTAIRMFDEQKKEEDAARAWLGLSLAQSGLADHAAALESAVKVATTAAKLSSEDLIWRAATREGEALRKLDRLDEARKAFERAIAAIDRLAADAPVNPDVRAQLDDSASAWTGLAMTLAAKGNAAGAFAAAEARRAHVRRVQLAGFQRDIAAGESPEEQADEQAIVREMIQTRAQLRGERLAGTPDAARIDKIQQQLAALVARRADQQTRLYTRLPELQEWRALRPPAGADDLAALVPDPKSVVLEYLLGDDEVLLLTVAHGEERADVAAKLVPLVRRQLAEQIGDAMQPERLRDAAEWTKRAAPLATTLIAPIALRLAGRDRCVIVPDDVLWRVPFEALPFGDAPLGASVRVTYATSASTLAVQRRIAAARMSAEHLTATIVAAPVIPDAIRTQITLAQPAWTEPDAAAAAAAAESLRTSYGDAGSSRTGAEATEAAMRTAFAGADVVHTSVPFQVSGANPLFSYLVFTGGAPPASAATPDRTALENDGRWEVREWFRGASRARVLAITDAASLGAGGAGSAMDTIAWAAAAAGVPALVLARWPKDGFAIDSVLTAFHAALAKGSSVANAWADALARARENGGDAPSAWAGARLVGAGG